MSWSPTDILRFERSFPTNSCAAQVLTDAGRAFIKAMGPHEHPNALACELIGTQLAEWLGLSTFDYAVVNLDEFVEIELRSRGGELIGIARPGPAFLTREETGSSWSGEVRQLDQLSNPEDISRLVVFDTWTLNCDRYRPATAKTGNKPRINWNNVFLSAEAPKGRLTLKAMDHGCCFTCGRELTRGVGNIDNIRNTLLFGRFPEFQRFMDRDVVRDVVGRLRGINKDTVASMMAGLPNEWEVRKEAIGPWIDLIVGRAAFVADTIEAKLWPQQEIVFPEKETDQ